MKQITWNKSRGLTLTELLAVLMILSLLTTIAVPVYVARQEDARIRVAMTECRQIADAEELVAAMHGFYVPFQLLDELPADPDDLTNSEERIDRYPAGLDDPYLITPTIRAEDQIGDQLRLSQGYRNVSNSHPRVQRLVSDWSGPFITWQRFWYDMTDSAPYQSPSDPQYRLDDDMFRDFPLDPWGNPYRFYSPIGIIGSGEDEEGELFNYANPDFEFSNGRLTREDDDRFQKYAVVSYGRDGLRDTEPANPIDFIFNDIVYEFGTDGVSRNFGKF